MVIKPNIRHGRPFQCVSTDLRFVWYFICYEPDQTFEQVDQLPAIWVTWCSYDATVMVWDSSTSHEIWPRFALCCILFWLIIDGLFPYPSGLLHWYWHSQTMRTVGKTITWIHQRMAIFFTINTVRLESPYLAYFSGDCSERANSVNCPVHDIHGLCLSPVILPKVGGQRLPCSIKCHYDKKC